MPHFKMGPIYHVLLDPKPDRENGKLALNVGVHEGCGGLIIYESQFVEDTKPMRPADLYRELGCTCRKPIPIMGPHPKVEKVKCSCRKCRLKFNPYFSLYRDQVLLFRKCTA